MLEIEDSNNAMMGFICPVKYMDITFLYPMLLYVPLFYLTSPELVVHSNSNICNISCHRCAPSIFQIFPQMVH